MSNSNASKSYFDVSESISYIYTGSKEAMMDFLHVPTQEDQSYAIGMHDAEFYRYMGSKPDTLLVKIEYTIDDQGQKQITTKTIVKEFTESLDTLEARCAALVPEFCATIDEAKALANLSLVGAV